MSRYDGAGEWDMNSEEEDLWLGRLEIMVGRTSIPSSDVPDPDAVVVDKLVEEINAWWSNN